MGNFRATHRHRKGGLYQLIGYGIHSETDEVLAIYRDSLGSLWIRPRAMFDDGRFTPLAVDPEQRRTDALAQDHADEWASDDSWELGQ